MIIARQLMGLVRC